METMPLIVIGLMWLWLPLWLLGNFSSKVLWTGLKILIVLWVIVNIIRFIS